VTIGSDERIMKIGLLMDEPYETLNKRWASVCRALLGFEPGSLKDYVPWLCLYTEPNEFEKSSVSSQQVAFAIKEYCSGSKRISCNEIDFQKKFEPLDINQIKDIDSIVQAVQERVFYAGNIILGKSEFVKRSTSISDCYYALDSARFTDSKYICNCTMGRFCDDCFGCHTLAESSWCIKCSQCHKNTRGFELWMCKGCQECYYSFGLDNCQDCLFSFNLRGKRLRIGNLELEKSKYLQIKEKLTQEIAQELVSKKKAPSLIEIIKASRREMPEKFPVPLKPTDFGKLDCAPIEKQFKNTSSLIFEKQLFGGMGKYSNWLLKNTRRIDDEKSIASGKKLQIVYYGNFDKLPRDRLISEDEAYEYGKAVSLSPEQVETLTVKNAHEKIGKLAFVFPEIFAGNNKNIIDCALSFYSSDCCKSSPSVYSKFCGYSFWPRNSSYCFGTGSAWGSEFCIKCYNSSKIIRCFECDSCHDCADSYFCHNCDGLRDCMFCFNVKNKHYAIGNSEVGRENYLKIKKIVLEEIYSKISSQKQLKENIFNIGCRKK